MSDGYGEFKRDVNHLVVGAAAVGILCVVPPRVRIYLIGMAVTAVLWAFTLDYHASENHRSPWTVWSYVWAVVFVGLIVGIVIDGVQNVRAEKAARLAAPAQPAFVPAPQPAPAPVTQRVERTVRVERTTPPVPTPATTQTPSRLIVVTNTHKPVRRRELTERQSQDRRQAWIRP